jgi:hypothetical protein
MGYIMANTGLKISQLVYTSLEDAINDGAQVPLAIDDSTNTKANRRIGVVNLKGYQGHQGNQGNQGGAFVGSQGAQGNQGSQGSVGNQGHQGSQGNQGMNGSVDYGVYETIDSLPDYTTPPPSLYQSPAMVYLGNYTPTEEGSYITLHFWIVNDTDKTNPIQQFEAIYTVASQEGIYVFNSEVLLSEGIGELNISATTCAASYNASNGNLYFMKWGNWGGFKLQYKVDSMNNNSLFTPANNPTWVDVTYDGVIEEFARGTFGTDSHSSGGFIETYNVIHKSNTTVKQLITTISSSGSSGTTLAPSTNIVNINGNVLLQNLGGEGSYFTGLAITSNRKIHYTDNLGNSKIETIPVNKTATFIRVGSGWVSTTPYNGIYTHYNNGDEYSDPAFTVANYIPICAFNSMEWLSNGSYNTVGSYYFTGMITPNDSLAFSGIITPQFSFGAGALAHVVMNIAILTKSSDISTLDFKCKYVETGNNKTFKIAVDVGASYADYEVRVMPLGIEQPTLSKLVDFTGTDGIIKYIELGIPNTARTNSTSIDIGSYTRVILSGGTTCTITASSVESALTHNKNYEIMIINKNTGNATFAGYTIETNTSCIFSYTGGTNVWTLLGRFTNV